MLVFIFIAMIFVASLQDRMINREKVKNAELTTQLEILDHVLERQHDSLYTMAYHQAVAQLERIHDLDQRRELTTDDWEKLVDDATNDILQDHYKDYIFTERYESQN